MRNLPLAFLLVLTTAFPATAADLGTFSAEDRQAIDARVVAATDGRTEKPKGTFYGTLAGWGIARTPMKAEKEFTLARVEHEAIRKSLKTSPAPPLADKVLKKLSSSLPGAAPDEFEYSLTIVETPEFRSWTVGGGFLYLSRPMYEALTNTEGHAEDRLAFVLAHEMGHIVRKHCRVGYQLLKLQDFARRESWKEEELSRLKKSVNSAVEVTGNRLRFLYEPQQEYQADLFAAHLCRNAGFDVEAGWDVLRQGVLAEEQGGDLSRDPAHILLSNDNSAEEQNRPSAADRLRQLCFDRDGVVRGSQFGLWEFDSQSDQWLKPPALQIAADERAVILVHGMDSQLSKCYLALARELAKERELLGVRILGFQYPGDASLTRVGEFLHRELSRATDGRPKLDFVCHSAGGLVVRYYAEVKGGAFDQILLQGTPNHGSDWARLRSVIEMKQFLKDLRSGYSQAIENAILDGQGQIAHDLQPGSLFLNHLNNRRADRSRYAIFRGRRFGRTRMFVLGQTLVVGKEVLSKEVETAHVPKIVRDRAMQSLDRLDLPEEVRRGDLVVSLESAELEGVREMQTFKLRHGELSRDPETIAATIELLKGDESLERAQQRMGHRARTIRNPR